MEEPEEFDRLLDIYNRYPFEELILHPRVQKDYYKNKPRLEYFEKALGKSTNPVCYNGDLFTIADYRRFKERFPSADRVMIGRGFIGNPALIEQIAAEESRTATTHEDTARLRQFHDRIYHEYLKIMSGDKNTIHKMKELWFYQKPYFDNADKAFKKSGNPGIWQSMKLPCRSFLRRQYPQNVIPYSLPSKPQTLAL